MGAGETDWEQVAGAHLFLAPAVTSGLIQTQEAALSGRINLLARWNDGLRNSVKMSKKTKLTREMWLIKEIPRPFTHRCAADMLHDPRLGSLASSIATFKIDLRSFKLQVTARKAQNSSFGPLSVFPDLSLGNSSSWLVSCRQRKCVYK